jgi:hypothetical protein
VIVIATRELESPQVKVGEQLELARSGQARPFAGQSGDHTVDRISFELRWVVEALVPAASDLGSPNAR